MQHRVPLTPAALKVLEGMTRRGDDALIFAGRERHKPISDMSMTMLMRRMGCNAVPHGWRSCFRDWAGDHGWPRDLAEAALAHTLGKVESAYARSDLVKRRRPMMEAWSAYLTHETAQVVPIKNARDMGISGRAAT
jgi:hypothetical protein